jgi:lipopolysaccharide transport system ATP-binding protein
MTTVISVENLSKSYRLGQIGTGTFARDLNVWWARLRGKPDPRLKIGETDHGNREGDEIWALKDVSFTVAQGEVLGIIGKNGAGKSTLLKILSRVTAPTSGKIKVRGRVASLLEVGTGFHPELTGRENIYLNGAILGMSKGEVTRKFDEIVDFSGVEKFIDTPVKRYSSGMYVRLAFAVAAHLDPEILVVDEVLAVGDVEFQKKCLGKISEVAQGGRTVLFVSHKLGAVKSLCKTGIQLDGGQINFMGDINNCVNHYLNIKELSDIVPEWNSNEDVNKLVRLSSIKISDENHGVKKQFSYKEPLWIKIEFVIQDFVSGIYLAMHVHDNKMETLIFSRDFDFNENNLTQREPGRYLYSIKIPAPLLVPGFYNISVHIAYSFPPRLIDGADHICFFEIIDDGSDRAKMGFPWRGKIVLPINWELENLNR